MYWSPGPGLNTLIELSSILLLKLGCWIEKIKIEGAWALGSSPGPTLPTVCRRPPLLSREEKDRCICVSWAFGGQQSMCWRYWYSYPHSPSPTQNSPHSWRVLQWLHLSNYFSHWGFIKSIISFLAHVSFILITCRSESGAIIRCRVHLCVIAFKEKEQRERNKRCS